MPRIKRHLYLASRAQPLTKKRRRGPGIQAGPPRSAPGPCAGRVVQAQQVAVRPGSQMTKPPASSRAGFASLRCSSWERGAGQRSHRHGSRFAPIPAARIILPLNAAICRFRSRSRRTAPCRSAAAGGQDAKRAKVSEIGHRGAWLCGQLRASREHQERASGMTYGSGYCTLSLCAPWPHASRQIPASVPSKVMHRVGEDANKLWPIPCPPWRRLDQRNWAFSISAISRWQHSTPPFPTSCPAKYARWRVRGAYRFSIWSRRRSGAWSHPSLSPATLKRWRRWKPWNPTS